MECWFFSHELDDVMIMLQPQSLTALIGSTTVKLCLYWSLVDIVTSQLICL